MKMQKRMLKKAIMLTVFTTAVAGMGIVSAAPVYEGTVDGNPIADSIRYPASSPATADCTVAGEKITIQNDAIFGIEYRHDATATPLTLTVGNATTKDILIDAAGAGSVGVFVKAYNGASDYGKVTANITAKDSITIKGTDWGFGIQGQRDIPTETSATITSKNITIEGGNVGVAVFSGAKLNLNATDTLVIKGTDAIQTRGGSATAIQGGTVKIDGDIAFDYSPSTSGTAVDANLTLNLQGEDSYWNGKSKITNNDVPAVGVGDVVVDQDGKFSVDPNTTNTTAAADAGKYVLSGFTVNLKDGATWTSDGDSFVNNVNLDGGIINMDGDSRTMLVGNIAGEGTVQTDSIDNTINAKNVANNANITVQGGSTLMQQVEDGSVDQNDMLQDLANVVITTNEVGAQSIATGVTLAEGEVLGEITADVSNGVINESSIQVRENTTNAGMIDMTALSLISWRGEFDDLVNRLGDLRSSREENGLWTRFSRAQNTYNSVVNQANMYQIGYDRQAGNWTVGLAYSYTDGSSTFANGKGENTHNVVSLYGTKMNANGTYLDLVAKYGNLDYEYDVVGGAGSANYDTDAYAFSAEVGKRITASGGAWFEPQLQLTYGTVDSVSYRTANGINVHQDSIDSLVARAGFMAGKPFAKGDIYLKASYLYDFEGEVKGTFANNNVSADINRDLGGGWWEVGFGMCAHLSDVTHIYLDFEKAFAGEVDTDWKYNAGLRYSF